MPNIMIDRRMIKRAGSRTALLLALCVLAASASAAPAVDEFAADFAEAWSREAWDAVAYAIHPDELARVRKLALDAIEAETKDGAKGVRTRLFGAAVSVDEIRRVTPHTMMEMLVKRFLIAPRAMKKTRVVGKIKDDKLQQIVVRGWVDEEGKGASSVVLVTLMPYGKQWAAAVPSELEEKTEAAIAGADVGSRDVGDSHVAALDPGILKVLDAGIAALKDGRCAEYYNDIMSPNFRKATSPSAVKTLIAQCEKNASMRDKTRAALEIARGLKPRYEYDNTRAVFDMSGQGLPFDRFVVEQRDKKWYIAE
jgi:hypothetical protein